MPQKQNLHRQPRWEDCTPQQQADFGELCRYLQQLAPELRRRLAAQDSVTPQA